MPLIPIRRALLSVSDKTGLREFAWALVNEFKTELLSTGGTARFLRDAGLPVTDVSAVTGFPEMMDGRIKTLHPKIHGGLLAIRDNPEHAAAMQDHGIQPIDLVCINLYPFEKTVSNSAVTLGDAIENIDIGGPAMVRSAAKNHRFVLIVISPDQYPAVLADLRANAGQSSAALRQTQAAAAFARISAYDAAITTFLTQQFEKTTFPSTITLSAHKRLDLRYGENPHQQAALYTSAPGGVANAKQLYGKELSYINILDADAATAAVYELPRPGACIVKHATPCGYAQADTLETAFDNAYAGDPVAAFGGIVALNRPVNLLTARQITAGTKFLEVICAPNFDPDALELLKTRWKNVRLLAVETFNPRLDVRTVSGGYLAQQPDTLALDESAWTTPSARKPSDQELADLRLAWLACKHIKSNAIAIARDQMLVGAGAGQQDRVGACRIAAERAGERAKGAVAASDAFFPFADGPEILLKAGVTAIIQPGGSVRDAETLAAVDRFGAAMVLTGQRHFRH